MHVAMNRRTGRALTVIAMAWVAATGSACGGPFVVFPGGALSGETKPVPESWSFAGDYGTMQLETNPREPYSVNIAYTIEGGVFYINAGDTETRWVKHISEDPRVRARIDGTLYEMRAVRVTDADEVARFGRAWTAQSMFRRDPTELDRVWLYRLVARTPTDPT